MAKGLFTQGMCVLLREPMSMSEVEKRLSMFTPTARQESLEDDDAPETLVMEYRPEVDGHLLVTPSSARWPDDMGEPDENPEAFVAWSLGQFGPLTYPGCLGRGLAQSDLQDSVREDALNHTAHVRVLISYIVGADDDDDSDDDLPLMPEGYNAIDELQTVIRAVTALLESPQAICYFNPGGELIMDDSQLRRVLNKAWNEDQPPLKAWVQTRRLQESNGIGSDRWHIIDSVGHGQLDIPDLEAVYVGDDYPEEQVEQFLEVITQELMADEGQEELFIEGEVREGPGDSNWRSFACGDALNAPPRPTIRWVPEDEHEVPEIVLDDMTDDEEEVADWMDGVDNDLFDDEDNGLDSSF